MMFGTREIFEYFLCTICGCLQIAEIPPDLGRHYPENYYSFDTKPECRPSTRLNQFLQKQRVRTAVFGRGYRLDSIAKRFVPLPEALHSRLAGLSTGDVLKRAGVHTFSARCLDVGCGSFSIWLHNLWQIGFNNLIGVDPYIEQDTKSGPVRILKCELADVDGRFDLITLHHSLEHMVDQSAALSAARHRLAPDGILLVRIPLVSSLAWQRYGINWVELDAPRHLYLHSIRSLVDLARAAGLELIEIIHDSLPFEFYGSELYMRGIPLTDPRSPWVNGNSTYFSTEEMNEFARCAEQVNTAGCGGRAGFYFRAAR